MNRFADWFAQVHAPVETKRNRASFHHFCSATPSSVLPFARIAMLHNAQAQATNRHYKTTNPISPSSLRISFPRQMTLKFFMHLLIAS
jgi:hypothetical protein